MSALLWRTEEDFDEQNNTRYLADSAVHDGDVPFVYRIEPELWSDKIVFTIGSSDGELVDDVPDHHHDHLIWAQRACQSIEDAMVEHAIIEGKGDASCG